MKKKIILMAMGLLLGPMALTGLGKPDVVPVQLRCEYRENPLGIDVVKPRLSWKIESRNQNTEDRGQKQTAYQILVASSEEPLKKDKGDLWDSGKVASDQSIQVEYQGKSLVSQMDCHWKVRVWDKKGEATDWSNPALWSMGLLAPQDWQAVWIRPVATTKKNIATAPWVRKVFTLASAPGRAMVFVNVLGYYELYVNGQKVSDEVLSPAVSVRARRSFYKTYDINKFLRRGRNCIGLWLGTGWNWPGPIARVQLDMSVGGQRVTIGTDRTWTFMPSSYAELHKWEWNANGSECIDARREIAGWSEPECTVGEWVPVEEIAVPSCVVTAQSCPPNRIAQVIPLAACTALGPNAWELDFGTNLTGWLRLRLPRLESGKRVVMHYADKRFQTAEGDDTPAGRIKPMFPWKFDTAQGPVCYQTYGQVDEFISAGKSGEQFCSKFNYRGFRYVIVEGLPARPAPGDAEALLIESDLKTAGTFECSNDLFNRIHQVNLWTIRCLSLGGYMVDCPHRERVGYGDGQVSIESQVMNRNAAAFYGKWAIDWLDVQNPLTGKFAHAAPNIDESCQPPWGGAGCVLPWKVYLYYADRRLLERAYEPMKRYTRWLDTKCTNSILRHYGGMWDFLGDWVPPGRGLDTDNWPPTPAEEVFNNCYRVYLLDHLAKAAAILGRTQEAQGYQIRIKEIRPLIHAAFYDAQKQIYVLDEQSYQVMPLMAGIVPDDLRETILKKLEDGILVKNKGHLDTGMLGTYFLIQYLQEAGRDDLLYTIFNQKTYPGWGYMLTQGATTFWEQWNGYWSQIHSCFTSPGGWFYQGLAGIRPDESEPGFKKIIIKPAVIGNLTWVKFGYDSIHGRIVSNWKREGDRLTMDVTIPINTTATLYVPAKDAAAVTESGKPTGMVDGVKFLRMENGTAVYEVGSGCYQFQSVMTPLGSP
ncbi:MAG: family 78 glycoside hydrolase catalytic domain [Candidatus Aminicenantales bacterium]|jgi:alpha-L-rhamnosidase